MKNKRIILLLCLSLMLTSLSGCKDTGTKVMGDAHYIPIFGCFEEAGSLYESNSILCYVDYVTGENGVLCSRPNCTHEPYSPSNPNPYCEAALPTGDLSVALISGNTLYVITTDFSGTELYTKQVYAETWEKLLEIPYGTAMDLECRIYDGKLYFTAASFTHESDKFGQETPSLQFQPFLTEIDLEQQTYRILTEYTEGDLYSEVLWIENNTLYYYIERLAADTVENTYQVAVYRLNLNTLESEYLFSRDDEHVFLGAHEGVIYACGTAGLMMLSEGRTWQCLYEAEAGSSTDGHLYKDGILLSLWQDNSCTFLYYDYETGEISMLPALPQENLLLDVVGEWGITTTSDGIGILHIQDYLTGSTEYTAMWKPY